MPEVYRKRGVVLRYENGTLIRVHEAGEAVEEGSLFRCAPAPGRERLPEIDQEDLIEIVRQIRDSAGDLAIERLIVTDGRAVHECEGRSWSDGSRRIHVSIASGSQRVLVDEGTFHAGAVEPLARHLARIGRERAAPARIRLSARVMAGLTQHLIHVARPDVIIEQVGGGIDGRGHPIEGVAGPHWPNWYRPSYRVRPLRLPLNVTARCAVTDVQQGLPLAVSLLAPPAGLILRVMCVEGEEVYPATVRVVRIEAISDDLHWFPYGAGVWAGDAEVVTS